MKTAFLAIVGALLWAAPSSIAVPPPGDYSADPWVLFCHTDPTESRIGLHADEFLSLDAQFAGPVARGWWGSSCSLYGKLKATSADGKTLVAEMPSAPNYIIVTVALGPVASGADRPSVQFGGGGAINSGPFSVSFKDGLLIANATNYNPPSNPPGAPLRNYFALREWRFMVLRQSEAEAWREGIEIRATLYSME